MKRLVAMVLAAAVGLPAFADDPPKPKLVPIRPIAKPVVTAPADDPKPGDGTSEEQLAKAKKEYEKAQREYMEKRQEAGALARSIYQKNPKADIALTAFELMMNTGGLIGMNTAKMYAEIAENHAGNPKIKTLMLTLGRTQGEAFLLKVLDKNPDKSVQAQACFMIAEAAAALVDREKDKAKSEELAEKAVMYFERAKAEFGDVVYQGDKMANVADGAMFSLKFLRPGKPVPEIEGPDMDGKTFKISDYKGKVVMLDFWGHW
jgi:hypothetical protein